MATQATIIPRYIAANMPHTERNKSTPSSFQRKYDNLAANKLTINVRARMVSQNEREEFDVRSIVRVSKGMAQVKRLPVFASPLLRG